MMKAMLFFSTGLLLAVLLTEQAVQAELIESPFEADPEFVPMPGGWFKLEVTDAEVAEITQFGVEAISDDRNSGNLAKVGTIVSARSHVVSGIKYNIVLDRHETNCPRSATNTGNCETRSTERCRVVIVDQPHMTPKRTLLGYNCVPLLG